MILGTPLDQLRGGFRKKIKAYVSSAFFSSVDEYIKDDHFAIDRGVDSFKIYPFQGPPRDIELCRIPRHTLGDGINMMVDVPNLLFLCGI